MVINTWCQETRWEIHIGSGFSPGAIHFGVIVVEAPKMGQKSIIPDVDVGILTGRVVIDDIVV